VCESAEECGGCGVSHELEGLANGGEAWDLVGGRLDVVEADNGDVAGDMETGVVECSDAAHRGDVVEAKNGGELLLGFE